MSSLIPSGQSGTFTTAMDNLWATFQQSIVVVKAPIISSVDISTRSFVPGYGIETSPSNVTYTHESGTFNALSVVKKPDGSFSPDADRVIGSTTVFIKVGQAARNYILDGRPNEKIIFKGQAYNSINTEGPNTFLTNQYYYFKLQSTQ